VFGLRGLPGSTHPGLRALLESANLLNEKLDAYHVGFRLAPRLNACGRMGHAQLAVELLTDASESKCREIARYLTQQNSERQKTEREITAAAVEMVRAQGLDRPENRAIVLASEDWHGGVIGIVASRLVDRFHRPAILIAINGDGTGQGSGRSIPGFDMHAALNACGEHLLSFGGHAMAGGLRVAQDKIESFATAMAAHAADAVADDSLVPAIQVDAEATLEQLHYQAVEHLQRLQPFGQGNPAPTVAIRGLRLLGPAKRMGRSGQTAGLLLGEGNTRMRAVGFGMGDLADYLVGVNEVDVVAEPVLNHFNGRTSVELKLVDVAWE
ncbi:MAG: single-stranded-DNA-specific exonuclease RecJ, partial [Phycisphaerae bacterium]